MISPLLNKRYLNGKLASYNTYGTPKDTRKTSLQSILGNRWDDAFFDYIDLENIFIWKCSDPVLGIGSDLTSCKGLGRQEQEGEMTSKAFGLINYNYYNPLLQ